MAWQILTGYIFPESTTVWTVDKTQKRLAFLLFPRSHTLCPRRCRVRFRPPGNPTARASAFLYPSPYAVVTAGNASKSEQYLLIEKKSRTVSGSDIKDGLNFNVIGETVIIFIMENLSTLNSWIWDLRPISVGVS